jgi:polar amino acid transport system substrate-binding protein
MQMSMEILIGTDKSGSIMRKTAILLGFTLLIAIVFLAGCTSPTQQGTALQTPTVTPTSDVAATPVTPALLFVTEQYPPYNYEVNGSLKGISVDLLRAISDKAALGIVDNQIQVMPWAVAYQIAQGRKNTGLFSTIRLPERESQFLWVGPIGTSQKVLFAKKDRAINISRPDDLKQYRIGYVQGDAAQSQLKALGIPDDHIVAYMDVPSLIAGTQKDRIDLWCYGDLAGRFFARQETGDPNTFATVYTLDKYDLYYAFNKDTPDSVVKSFQDALDAIRNPANQSGISQYQRIVNQNT